MKKLVSILTAVFMCIPYAAYANSKQVTTPTGWTTEYREPTAEEQANISDYIPSTDEMHSEAVGSEDSHTGKNSFKFVNTRAKKQSHTYAELAFGNGLPEGEYTLEFYAKGDFEPKGIEAGFGENTHPKQGSLLLLSNSKYSKSEADENGWVKYSAILKCAAGNKLHFRVDYGCSEIYIDDVSVLDGDENIISNGGFEETETTEISVPKGDDYRLSDSFSAEYPKMVYVQNMDLKVGINWQNAAKSGIAEVGIYKVTSDGDVLVDNSFSKSSDAWCSYMLTKDDTADLYKLITSFSDGTKTEYLISQTTTYKGSVSDWSISYNAGAEGKLLYVPGVATVDENVAHSGGASLKLDFSSPIVSNLFTSIRQNLDFELGSKYHVSLWSRGERAGFLTGRYGWQGFDCVIRGNEQDYDWKYSEFVFNYENKASSNELFFNMESPTHAMWVDDFEVYKLDENGNKVGDNMIANPGFEQDVMGTTPSAPKRITAAGDDASVSLSWSGATDAERIKLYRLVDGKYVFIGLFDNTAKKNIVVGNLENDTEQTFAVAAMNKHYVESEKTICKVYPTAPDTRVGKAEIDGGLKQGSNTVRVKIDNNKQADAFEAEVIAVVRKGKLITEIKNEKVSLATGESKTCELTVNIPEIDGYSVTVYTWNDFAGMKKLADNKVFKAE